MLCPAKANYTKPLMCNPSKAIFTGSYNSLFTEEAIFHAYLKARRGKRKKKYIQNFEMSLGKNLADLRQDLLAKTYRPEPVREFPIWCTAGQKVRQIRAPGFRDIIAQFVVYDAIYPIIDKAFIYNNYGCRRGKGAHRAANKVQEYIRSSPKNSYYLQLDIRKYYYNIDHVILRKILKRHILDNSIVDLIMLFVSDNIVGVNVGSLIAQLLGLMYLNQADHYIKRKLKIRKYVRYVDDMLLIGLDKNTCYYLLNHLSSWFKDNLHLSLSHWKINKLSKGINFCGYRTWHDIRLIRKRSLKTFNRRLKKFKWQSIESLLAHAEHSATYFYFIKKLLKLNIKFPDHIQWRIVKWQSFHIKK